MKNKVYNRPEIEIVRFEMEDVLKNGISLPDLPLSYNTESAKAWNLQNDSDEGFNV